jgi:hypothetical protein
MARINVGRDGWQVECDKVGGGGFGDSFTPDVAPFNVGDVLGGILLGKFLEKFIISEVVKVTGVKNSF